MNRIKLLLVEDEETLTMIIKDTLEAQNFDIVTAMDGEEGLQLSRAMRPDVIVADVMMPRMDGFEMVRRIRETDKLTPVLFLTARSEVKDVVTGFNLGADDYLRKPFGMQELIVRINHLLHRASINRSETDAATGNTVGIGSYRLDLLKQKLIHNGREIELSHRETEILRMLASAQYEVVETRDILLKLWGNDSIFNARSLQVFITKLRHKLARDKQVRIINVRGIGYKLVAG